MARKLTKDSLTKLKSTGSIAQDKLLQRLLWAIHNNEFELTQDEPSMYEDDAGIEFDCESFYGEFKSIGITIKQLKKYGAIYPRYYIQVETDDDTFEAGGEYGAKAWKLASQVKTPQHKVDEDKLLALLEDLD